MSGGEGESGKREVWCSVIGEVKKEDRIPPTGGVMETLAKLKKKASGRMLTVG